MRTFSVFLWEQARVVILIATEEADLLGILHQMREASTPRRFQNYANWTEVILAFHRPARPHPFLSFPNSGQSSKK